MGARRGTHSALYTQRRFLKAATPPGRALQSRTTSYKLIQAFLSSELHTEPYWHILHFELSFFDFAEFGRFALLGWDNDYL